MIGLSTSQAGRWKIDLGDDYKLLGSIAASAEVLATEVAKS